jgi:hypothetical protein
MEEDRDLCTKFHNNYNGKKLHDPYSVMKDQAGLLDYLQ